MSLVYKATQVLAIGEVASKPYELAAKDGQPARSGISHSAEVVLLGNGGQVATVRVKGKTPDEVRSKLRSAGLTVGKSAELQILDVAERVRGILVLVA